MRLGYDIFENNVRHGEIASMRPRRMRLGYKPKRKPGNIT